MITDLKRRSPCCTATVLWQNDQPPGCYEVTGPLPAALQDEQRLAEKLERDQRKLLAVVEYVNFDNDRKDFLARYFGLQSDD